MLEDKDLLSIQQFRSKVEKAYAAWQKYRHQTHARANRTPALPLRATLWLRFMSAVKCRAISRHLCT